MDIVRKILSRYFVLYVRFTDPEKYELSLVECSNKGSGSVYDVECETTYFKSILRKLRKIPVIVAYHGYGIVSKKCEGSANIIERVTAADSDFLWNKYEDRISFMRRTQSEPIERMLLSANLKWVSSVCICADIDNPESAEQQIKYEYGRCVCLRNLVSLTIEGANLAHIMASRLKIIVVITVMGLILVNAAIVPRVKREYQRETANLATVKRDIGTKNKKSKQRQTLLSQFGRDLPYRFAIVCDRIAAVLPEGVVLDEVCVQPLAKSSNRVKQLSVVERTVTINGRASGSEDISDYVNSLRETEIASSVTLSLMMPHRDGNLSFRIVVEI